MHSRNEYIEKVTTPISCGDNPYGHPMASIEAALKVMQAGGVPWRTSVNGNWSKVL